jgi:predicted amidohydrolase
MENAPSIQWLKNKATTLNCLCIASLIIEDQGQYFNRMIACFPDGSLDYYDKIHLFSLAKEDAHFTPGDSKKIITYKGWRIMLQICYDLRFPETGRNSVSANGIFDYDLLLYVANWPEKRISHWNTLIPARAIENQAYVAAVNRIGKDENNLSYSGCSQIVSPNGDYLSPPLIEAESLTTSSLSRGLLLDLRAGLSFLKDKIE